MGNVDTPILFYNIRLGDAASADYIDWALSMLEQDHDSFSLKILSSLSEHVNAFEIDDFFRRAIQELHLHEPSHEECAQYYIQQLAKRILMEDENSTIDLAYKIYKVVDELDNFDGLEEWYEISEMIDDFRYGDNRSNITRVALLVTIEREAKKTIKLFY